MSLKISEGGTFSERTHTELEPYRQELSLKIIPMPILHSIHQQSWGNVWAHLKNTRVGTSRDTNIQDPEDVLNRHLLLGLHIRTVPQLFF